MDTDEKLLTTKYPEIDTKLQSILYICFNEPYCALFSLSCLDRSDLKLILDGLIHSRPPYKELLKSPPILTTLQFQWLCYCLSKSLNIVLDYNLIPFYLNETFELYNQPFSIRSDRYNSIAKVLKKLNKFHKNQIPDFLYSNQISASANKVLESLTTIEFDAIVTLSQKFPQMFRALSPYFETIFNIININKFYQQYSRCLLPIMNIENLDLKNVSFDDYPDLAEIIEKTILDYFYFNNFPHSYQYWNKAVKFESTTTFLYRVQQNFFQTNPWPKKTFYGNYSLLFSLLNTSLAKREHFIDLTGRRCISLLKENDYKNALDSLALFPQMQSWAVVAVYHNDDIRNNVNFLSDVLPLLNQDLKPSISMEFLERSYNENMFKIQVSQMTGQMNTDFSNSIPYILRHILNPKDSVSEFYDICNKKILVYADDERIKDRNFFVYYFAVVDVIQCITENKDVLELNKTLHLMMNDLNKHTSILIDLFSLIFLQVNGKFICGAATASQILSVLSSYVISDSFLKIFTKSIQKVQISNLLFPDDDDLNHILMPNSELFDMALLSHDWQLAERLENKDKKLQIKRETFYEVYNFGQEQIVDKDLLDTKSFQSLFISSEIGLSYENKSDFLKIAKSSLDYLLNNNKNDYSLNELKEVIDNRKPDPFHIISLDQEFYLLSNKLKRIQNSKWEETKISNNYINYHLFSSFFAYLDHFIPTIFNLKHISNTRDALSIQQDKLLFTLYSENNVSESVNVSNFLKIDLYQTLILYSNDNNLELPFIDKYPIVNLAECAFSDKKSINDFEIKSKNDDSDEDVKMNLNSRVLVNLKKIKNIYFYNSLKTSFSMNKNENLNEISSYDDVFYLNNVPTKYFEKLLTDLIQKAINTSKSNSNENKPSLDVEKVAEISFSVSSSFFETLIMKNIFKIDLNELKKLSEISNCSDTLAESINFLFILSKDFQSIFPLENLLKHFLLTGSFKLASKLCSLFRYQMKTSKVLREVAISLLHQEKSIKHILNVCPQLKNELIESLPQKLKEKAIQDGDNFFDLVPKKWTKYKDPKTTFILNLNDDSNAYSLFQKLPTFNIDHELLSLFQTPLNFNSAQISLFENFTILTLCLKKLLKYFRNPYEPCQKVLTYLIQLVSNITVNNEINESYISLLIHRIHTTFVETSQIINKFFSSYPENLKVQQKQKTHIFNKFFSTIPLYCEYTRVLSNFVSCFFNSKFGLTYSFHEFESKQKASDLMAICFKYDFSSIGSQFMDAWNLFESMTLYDDYALILFKLGRFDDGLKMCIDRRMKKSLRTMSIADRFYDTCFYSQLFDQNNIKKLAEIDVEMLKKYNPKNDAYINSSDGASEDTLNQLNQESDQELFDYITNDLSVNRKNILNSSVWNYVQHNVENNESDTENSENFQFMPLRSSEESLTAANRYLKLKAPLFMRVKKLVMNGNFDKALKLAMNNSNKNIGASNNIKFDLGNTITRSNSNRNYPNSDLANCTATNNNNTSSSDSQNDNKNNSNNIIKSSDDSIIHYKENQRIQNSPATKSPVRNQITRSSSVSIDGNTKSRNMKIVFSNESTIAGSKKGFTNSNTSRQRIIQENFNLFLDNIFVVSISYSNFSKMKVKLLEFDPTLHFFGSFVEKLLQFAMNNSMPHLQYELEMFLGRTDSAVLTSISLYQESKSFTDLENAFKAVKKEMTSRRDKTKKAPDTLCNELIESYSIIIPLQMKFMKFTMQHNDENSMMFGSDKLSLFNGKKSAISIVIVLFKNYNFPLALEIINTCKLDVSEIGDALCDVLFNENDRAIVKLIRSLEDSFPDDIFMKIVNRILFRLFYVIEERSDLALYIIENSLKNEEYRTKLFLQFGLYEKAFENTKKWKLPKLMPLIACKALALDSSNKSVQIASEVEATLNKFQRSNSQDF